MKLLSYILLVLTLQSCLVKNRIYYSKSIKKSIHNLEQMQRWLQEDYSIGDIEHRCANNYMVVVINTKCSLYKKIKEKHEDCAD